MSGKRITMTLAEKKRYAEMKEQRERSKEKRKRRLIKKSDEIFKSNALGSKLDKEEKYKKNV